MECFSSRMATSTWGVVEEHRNFKFCFTLHKNDKETHNMFQIAIRENALSKAKPTRIQQIWKWLILQVECTRRSSARSMDEKYWKCVASKIEKLTIHSICDKVSLPYINFQQKTNMRIKFVLKLLTKEIPTTCLLKTSTSFKIVNLNLHRYNEIK